MENDPERITKDEQDPYMGKDFMILGNPNWMPKRRTTVLAALVAGIGSFGLGTVLTWSAPAIPNLSNSTEFGDILQGSSGHTSWLTSIAVLGAMISSLATAAVLKQIGRKSTMMIYSIPFVIGWGCIAFACNLYLLYLGRFITGFCGGAFTVVVPVYVSEITEERVRGALATVMIFMLVSGSLFTYVIGGYFSWSILSLCCMCVPLLLFISLFFIPESPRYLLSKKRSLEARMALKWLRRASTKKHIEPEIFKIETSIEQSRRKESNVSVGWANLAEVKILKPIALCSALMVLCQLSGANAVSFYTVEVFRSAGTDLDANLVSIIVGACQVVTVLLVPILLVDRLGRRTLLLASEFIMIISLVAFGVFFYLKEKRGSEAVQHLTWLPVTSLISYIIGYNVGCGPLPWVVTSEILPHHVKDIASSLITALYWILAFVAAQTFEILAKWLGWYGFYWLSAGICALGAAFVVFLLPETKGKSNDEIQKLFERSDGSKNFQSATGAVPSSQSSYNNPSLSL